LAAIASTSYKGKVSTPTADLETIKILLNSTVSTSNAKMLTANNITMDWTASMYGGITLKWDYDARTVDLPMPGYIKKSPQNLP
jgi:hypothetical protein